MVTGHCLETSTCFTLCAREQNHTKAQSPYKGTSIWCTPWWEVSKISFVHSQWLYDSKKWTNWKSLEKSAIFPKESYLFPFFIKERSCLWTLLGKKNDNIVWRFSVLYNHINIKRDKKKINIKLYIYIYIYIYILIFISNL